MAVLNSFQLPMANSKANPMRTFSITESSLGQAVDDEDDDDDEVFDIVFAVVGDEEDDEDVDTCVVVGLRGG